jgi:hypothetical protein
MKALISEVVDNLKSRYKSEQLQGCVRFEGVVDVYYMRKKSAYKNGGIAAIFSVAEEKWYYPKTAKELEDIAVNQLEHWKDVGRQEIKKQKVMNRHDGYTGFKYTDQTKIPFGKHEGEKLANIPAEYLIWLFENNRTNPPLTVYVRENLDNLRKEVAMKKKGIR